jgi:hypothetical protein
MVLEAPCCQILFASGVKVELEATPRNEPFIWATWLAKVMSGRVNCQWQYWFQSHHKLLSKQPSTFDVLNWQIGHTRLLTEVKQELLARGLRPRTEVSIKFELPGLETRISGKADCVVVDGSEVMLYDFKTGRQHKSDRLQVMIYMYGLATLPLYASSRIRGTVVYRDERVSVPDLSETFESDLTYFARLLSAATEPQREPGPDCAMCAISSIDCPDRPGPPIEATQRI